MRTANPADAIRLWAGPRRTVAAALLFGSQTRGMSDPLSDWDVQLYVWRPSEFQRLGWVEDLGLGPPRHVAFRRPLWGRGVHASVAWTHAELDVSIVSAPRFAELFAASWLGLHRRNTRAQRTLRDLAQVLRPGWRMLKRCAWVERTLRVAQRDLDDPRLSNREAIHLAARVEADGRSIAGKLERGELIAAQRLLHREIAEANLQLFRELRLRRGERAGFDGRRLEASCPPEEQALVTIDSRCEPTELAGALQRAVGNTRRLLADLVKERTSP